MGLFSFSSLSRESLNRNSSCGPYRWAAEPKLVAYCAERKRTKEANQDRALAADTVAHAKADAHKRVALEKRKQQECKYVKLTVALKFAFPLLSPILMSILKEFALQQETRISSLHGEHKILDKLMHLF